MHTSVDRGRREMQLMMGMIFPDASIEFVDRLVDDYHSKADSNASVRYKDIDIKYEIDSIDSKILKLKKKMMEEGMSSENTFDEIKDLKSHRDALEAGVKSFREFNMLNLRYDGIRDKISEALGDYQNTPFKELVKEYVECHSYFGVDAVPVSNLVIEKTERNSRQEIPHSLANYLFFESYDNVVKDSEIPASFKLAVAGCIPIFIMASSETYYPQHALEKATNALRLDEYNLSPVKSFNGMIGEAYVKNYGKYNNFEVTVLGYADRFKVGIYAMLREKEDNVVLRRFRENSRFDSRSDTFEVGLNMSRSSI